MSSNKLLLSAFLYHCAHCNWEGDDDVLESFANAKNLDQRVASGELAPSGVCPECGELIEVPNEKVPENTLNVVAAIMRERGWLVAKPDSTIDSHIQVSLDGGDTYHVAPSGVRIVLRNVTIPDGDGQNELHVTATNDGLNSEVWTTSDYEAPGVDHKLATESVAIKDYVQQILNRHVQPLYFSKKSANGLYQLSISGNDYLVTPQGGGFMRPYTKENFEELFTEVKVDKRLRKGTVSAEFLPAYTKIDCYATGLLWNGWGQPLFDRVNAQIAVQHLSTFMEIKFEGDNIVTVNDDYQPEQPTDVENSPHQIIEPSVHMIDGQPIQLWLLGNGWTWDAVTFKNATNYPTVETSN